MTIYLDIIFLENLCMNYIILLATNAILRKKINYSRTLIASLIGSFYAVISMMNIIGIYSNITLKIMLSVVMVYISFSSKNLKALVKELVLFYLTSFTFGGVAFALLYFVKPQDILMKNGIYIGTYPIKIALLGGIVGFIVLTTAFKLIKQKLSKKDMFCNVCISFVGKEIQTKAMLDTGNCLKEPITGMPVMIVEATALTTLLPDTVLEHLKDMIEGKMPEKILQNNYEFVSRFRIIPFMSLGKQNGLLLGFRPDYILIKTEEKEAKLKDVIIGIYDKKLTKDDSYKALLGLEILERSEKKLEYIGIN